MRILWIILLLMSFSISINGQNEDFLLIPTGRIHVVAFETLGYTYPDNIVPINVNWFELSSQVTLGEYKAFLSQIEKDSSEEDYQNLLPDTSIGPVEQYIEYLSNPTYKKYPVVGVSWDNAMKYCLWKTLQENTTGKISHYYTLPENYEYLRAVDVLKDAKKKDRKKIAWDEPYSNWLLRSYSYSNEGYIHSRSPDVDQNIYFEESDLRNIAGNSFLFQIEDKSDYFNGYRLDKNRGYKHVSFRLVKHTLKENESMSKEDFLIFWETFNQ